MLNRYIHKIILLLLQSIMFLYVFGNKLIKADSILFADGYDASKNYFNYYYYTNIQKGGGALLEGMNYPFGEYIFYADITPVLACLAKYFHIESSIGFYNVVFLFLWFIVPFVAYGILRHLNIEPLIAIIFGWLICWTNPLLNFFGSTVNLSMFVFYLLSFLLLIYHVKEKERGKIWLYTGAQVVLIYLASFFHLYYLPIILLFLGGAYVVSAILLKNYKLLFHAVLLAVISAVAVYATIYFIDDYYTLRGAEARGYDYFLYKNMPFDIFKSLVYLDFPNYFKYQEWSEQKWSFLGNGYPMAILLGLLAMPALIFRKRKLAQRDGIILGMCVGAGICLFVSYGQSLSIMDGKYEMNNYFSLFYYGMKFSDFFTNFRYLARFSAPFWMAYFILIAFLTNAFYNRGGIIAGIIKVIACIFVAISLFDAVQYSRFHHHNYERQNFLSKTALQTTVDFTGEHFDAIFPIPFFHVGTDRSEYTIDDPDEWSKELYQLSVKNKLPLMACKLARTPAHFAMQTFSLFEPQTNSDILKRLQGKKILLAVKEDLEWNHPGNATAMKLKSKVDFFMIKHSVKFIKRRDRVAYYELYFR